MKCKFCDAELEEENLICPGCGAENVPEFVPEEAVMPAAEEAEAPAAEKVPAVSGLSGWKLALVIGVCGCSVYRTGSFGAVGHWRDRRGCQ